LDLSLPWVSDSNTPFPSDIDDDHDSDFIVDDDNEANSEVKLHRKNITNAMWKSYLDYIIWQMQRLAIVMMIF
jgi:hypothetical protein